MIEIFILIFTIGIVCFPIFLIGKGIHSLSTSVSLNKIISKVLKIFAIIFWTLFLISIFGFLLQKGII